MISSIITPFRWYDKYYQQNRWDIECKSVCEFQLITDQTKLLPFQFKRTPSMNLITDWILRKCCTDTGSPLLSPIESNFNSNWISDTGPWIKTEDCNNCGITADTSQGYANTNICYNGLTIGVEYTITFEVPEFLSFGGFAGNVVNSTIIQVINSAGNYSVTFTATATEICFNYINTGSRSVLKICNVQIIPSGINITGDDIVLPIEFLQLKNFGDFDLITYCGTNFGGSVIPVGCYYSIIKDEGGNLYFSEIITVKKFDSNKSPYFLLEWYNSCDLKDVVYSGANGCDYKNKLYLPDAVLTKPQYPFKEEGEEDGNQNFNATFQKWEKIISLFAYKLPEYIVDALTAIKLHNSIKYYYPLRQKQYTIDSAITIKRLEYDTQYVIDDCFANVELKLVLDEQIIDETCCSNLSTDCKTCSKNIPGLNVFDSDEYQYALIEDGVGGSIQLYQFINSVWAVVGQYVDGVWASSVSMVGDLICDDSLGSLSGVGSWQIQNTEIVFCPSITSFVPTTGLNWMFIGNILLGTFGQIQYSNDGFFWNAVLPKFSQYELKNGIELEIPACCCNLYFKLRNFDLNDCNYGITQSYIGTCQTSDCC